MEYVPLMKIIVVGDLKVGKTCLLTQYCESRFNANQDPTIGCDFTNKESKLNGKKVHLQFWEISGEDIDNPVTNMYTRGSLGCVIVSDIQDKNSLEKTIKWKRMIEKNCEIDGKCIPIMLVQNKCETIVDGERQEFQQPQYLENFAKQNGFVGSVQASAKTKVGLEELFQKIIQEVIDRGLVKEQPIPKENFSQSHYMIAALIVIPLGYLMKRYLL